MATIVIDEDNANLIIDALKKELGLVEWRSNLEKYKGTQYSKEQAEIADKI